MGSVKFAACPQVCAVLCEISKQAVNISAHQDVRCPSTGMLEILDKEARIPEI
jgi:hypothetical protein